MNKRIIIIFACLLLVVIPVVLFSAVFIIRDVDVVGIGDEFEFDAEKIRDDSRISLKSSIFVLSEKNAIHNVELRNPNIKVVDIERIFPSKVVVNITERIPVFGVRIKDTSRYALLDRELRVVDIVDNLDASIVDYKSYSLELGEGVQLGKSIISMDKNDKYSIVIDGVIKGFENAELTNKRFTQAVDSVDVDIEGNRIHIHMSKGSTLEVFAVSNIPIETLVQKVLTNMYIPDVNASSSDADALMRVERATYFYNAETKTWDYRFD